MSYVDKIIQAIEGKKDLFINLSDSIWDIAETKFEEYQSAELYCGLLEEQGFQVEKGIGGLPTAFKGTFGKEGPTIGYLGEFDALPNLDQKADCIEKQSSESSNTNGHGCGHQLLGAGAFAAAVALKEYIKQGQVKGRVIFYGCPAEEGGSGKAWMVRENCFDESDVILTWHPGNTNTVLPCMALASIQAVFTFHGISAHAASCPHLGRSALDAVELMNVGVNFLREHVIQEARMHYAITDTGGNFANVVQSEASVLYQLRAPKMSQANDIYERVKCIAQGAALMTGTTVEVKFDRSCSDIRLNETLNSALYHNFTIAGPTPVEKEDIKFAKEIRKTLSPEMFDSDEDYCIKCFGEAGLETAKTFADKEIIDCIYPEKIVFHGTTYSTDVGDVSQVIPTAEIQTTCFAKDTPGHSWQMVAQGKNNLAHKGMLQAGKVLGLTGAYLLGNPSIIKEAKIEFDKRYEKEPYISPIPKDAKPPIPTKK